MKTVKIDILDYMDDVHALEFVRLLHEHKDKNGVVQLVLPNRGGIVNCELNQKFDHLRLIDSPPTPEDER